MTVVKICGITNTDDARIATDLGADMIGFNFFTGSPRYIAPKTAAEIVEAIGRDVDTVGVFVNEDVDLVLNIADKTGIKAIQLHGDETPDHVRMIRKKSDLKIIKALRFSGPLEAENFDPYDADAFLVDSYSPHRYGGTGELSDWDTAREAVAVYPRVFLAGGLTPANVGSAISIVRPFGVDVASGVESSDRRKDPEKLRDFIHNAKRA